MLFCLPLKYKKVFTEKLRANTPIRLRKLFFTCIADCMFVFESIFSFVKKISAGGFVTQLELRRIIILEAKRFYIWKLYGKSFRKKYVASVFLSICAFYIPEKMTS